MENDSEERGLPLPVLCCPVVLLGTPLPVSGGWGYSLEDACFIEASFADEECPYDAAQFVAIRFIEDRLLQELNTMQADTEFSKLRWRIEDNKLHCGSNGRYRYVQVPVSVRTSCRRGETGQTRYAICRDFWFDMQHIRIPDDAAFSCWTSGGTFQHTRA